MGLFVEVAPQLAATNGAQRNGVVFFALEARDRS
jgi:hypothetical protein